MARKIEVSLEADTSDFESGMKSASASVDKLEANLKSADGATSKFDSGLGKVNDGLSTSTDKFRSTADLAGGLGDVLGISALGPMAQYATGMADIADGMGGLLAPALTKAKVAFASMNATMLANPIFLVIAAIAALGIAFVIAYKKSETFRKIVNATFSAIKQGAGAFVDYVVDAVQKAAKVIARVADIITLPYKIAFKAIATAWNATLGGFHIGIPGFLGFGGFDFTIPNLPIPKLAAGGPLAGGQVALVGERGPELFVPNQSGTVVPNGQFGAQRLEIHLSGDAELVALMRRSIKSRGGNVVTVLSS